MRFWSRVHCCGSLAASAVATSIIMPSGPLAAQRTRVVLLGTGTPNADPDRSGPSVAVVVDSSVYIVDAGPGVVRRAAAAVATKARPKLLVLYHQIPWARRTRNSCERCGCGTAEWLFQEETLGCTDAPVTKLLKVPRRVRRRRVGRPN